MSKNNGQLSQSKVERLKIWDHHIGIKYGEILCPECNNIPINQLNFVKAHILARAHGGDRSIPNLIPICNTCNEDCGTATLDVTNIQKNIMSNKRKALDSMTEEFVEYDKRQKIGSVELKNKMLEIHDKTAQICCLYKKYILDNKEKIYRFNVLIARKTIDLSLRKQDYLGAFAMNKLISSLYELLPVNALHSQGYTKSDSTDRRNFNDLKDDFLNALIYETNYEILYDAIEELKN